MSMTGPIRAFIAPRLQTGVRALVGSTLLLTALGCGQVAGLTAHEPTLQRDWSGFAARSVHPLPHRAPGRLDTEGAGRQRKYLANAASEMQTPDAFALTPQTDAFRKAEEAHANSQRIELARRIEADSNVMAAFDDWKNQSDDARLEVLKRISAIEGETMGFTVPPMSPKNGIPKDGTLAYFDAGNTKGIGQVVLYPKAIGKGDKWSAIATVTHEMRHAYQWQLEMKGAKHQLTAGTVDEILAAGFSQADKVIDSAGGEDNLSYGDYSHLCNEYDAFATGNLVAKLVSHGAADTSILGFVDVQYNASGAPKASLLSLEAKFGITNLIKAVNDAQQAEDKRTGFVPA
jgi:hypothetical protein